MRIKMFVIFFGIIFLVGLTSAVELGKYCTGVVGLDAGYDLCSKNYMTDHGMFYAYCEGVCKVADGLNGNLNFQQWCANYGENLKDWGGATCANFIMSQSYSGGDLGTSYDYRHNPLIVRSNEEGTLREYYYDHFFGIPYASWTRESGWVANAIDPSGKTMWTEDERGSKIVFTYDDLERLTRMRVFNSEGGEDYWIDYCYDGYCNDKSIGCNLEGESSFNFLCEIKHKNGRSFFKYDLKGRLKERKMILYDEYQGYRSYTFYYDYNLDDTLKKVTYPNEDLIEYEYNKLGQITRIKHNGRIISNLDYAGFGGITEKEIDPSGEEIYASYVYDNKNQLATMYYSKDSPYNFGNRLFARGMRYDALGNVLGISNNVNEDNPTSYMGDDEGYTYDGLYRLTTANYYQTSDLYEFTYKNLLGDRGTKTVNGQITNYNYVNNWELESTNGGDNYMFEYDENGNIVSSLHDGSENDYIYDAMNRMTKAVVDLEENFYTYDENNNRIIKRDGSGTTYYVYDLGKIAIEEKIGNDECSSNCGDINGDGEIDEEDVNSLINYIWGTGKDINLCAANVDGSSGGLVNYEDVMRLYIFVHYTTSYQLLCTYPAKLDENPTKGNTLEQLRLDIEGLF